MLDSSSWKRPMEILRDIGKGATVSESSNSRNHLQHGNYISNNHGLHFGKLLEILIVLITENQINLCFANQVDINIVSINTCWLYILYIIQKLSIC